MREVSDAFLFNIAEVSATLIGLFLVGVFFYAETGFRRLEHARGILEPYFRSGTKIVLILYAIPLILSLTLVALEPAWTRALFVILSLGLIAANVETIARIRVVGKVTGSRAWVLNEVVGTVAVIALVTIPWTLGGLEPTREHFAWSILLSLAAGLLSTSVLMLSVFDIAR